MSRYKRWFTIGGNDAWMTTLRKCRRLGMAVVNGGKPGFVAWYGLCLLATPDQIRTLEAWWDERGIKWFNRRPRGAWDVSSRGNTVPWDEALKNAAK